MRNSKLRIITIVTTLLVATLILVSCSIDVERLEEGARTVGEGIENLITGDDGDDTNGSDGGKVDIVEPTSVDTTEIAVETEESQAPDQTSVPAESTIPEGETTTPPPSSFTPTSTPTSTPTPTPIPEPQRVNFSELTNYEILEGIELNTEEFEEEYYLSEAILAAMTSEEIEEAEDSSEEDYLLATFTGNRAAIAIPENARTEAIINFYLEAYYQQAEAMYMSVLDNYIAQALVQGEVTEAFTFNVEQSCSINSSLMIINQSYSALDAEEASIISSSETLYISLLTGQLFEITELIDIDAVRADIPETLAEIGIETEMSEEELDAAISEATIDVQLGGENVVPSIRIVFVDEGDIVNTFVPLDNYLTSLGYAHLRE